MKGLMHQRPYAETEQALITFGDTNTPVIPNPSNCDPPPPSSFHLAQSGARTQARFPHRPDWPDPQSQSLSRSYGSNLPTSLTYINLSTRGFLPWRPVADMGTPWPKNHRQGGRHGGREGPSVNEETPTPPHGGTNREDYRTRIFTDRQ